MVRRFGIKKPLDRQAAPEKVRIKLKRLLSSVGQGEKTPQDSGWGALARRRTRKLIGARRCLASKKKVCQRKKAVKKEGGEREKKFPTARGDRTRKGRGSRNQKKSNRMRPRGNILKVKGCAS